MEKEKKEKVEIEIMKTYQTKFITALFRRESTGKKLKYDTPSLENRLKMWLYYYVIRKYRMML